MTSSSIAALRQRLDAGQLSALEVCQTHLERIAAIDQDGPRLNAVIELNPQALNTAAQLDQERRTKGSRGPLHGIPILLKDNIDTADDMTTTAGSLALEGSKPRQDAFLVQRLRAAGAVILGKTNLSEWANFRSNRSTSGWSSRGGQTRNPYILDRSPCGSSSGSGVAVAAELCAAAVGTETDGSIVCPSSTNGIVGIKPTLGRISRSGIIPIAASQDTAGPMARNVADAALLLGAMSGQDERDPATRGHAAVDYTHCLDAGHLHGMRLGIVRSCCGFDERVDRVFEEALTALRQLGAQLVDPAPIETSSQFGAAEFAVLLYEFKDGLNRYLAGLGPNAPIKTLAELIDFNETHRDQVMPFFGQETLIKAQDKGPLSDAPYQEALALCRQKAGAEGIDATLQKHALDALIAPTGGPAWTIDLVNGDHGRGGCSSPAAVAGYPHITVPAGFVHHLPVGLSFFAGAHSEATLIRLAYAFEQSTQARQPPQFLPQLPT